jgi:hypothetical protein
MKKNKDPKDYPLEEITLDDLHRLHGAGWDLTEQRGGVIKLSRLNKAGMTSLKFVKIIC